MRPDFFCVGAYRSGTTWLHAVLSNHPGVLLPSVKETMFFSHYYERGEQWYEELFSAAGEAQRAGEICPTYLTPPEVAERIHAFSPQAQILAILRDPVDQIRSLYKLKIMRGYTDRPLDELLLQDNDLLKNVRYHTNLQRYIGLFGRERVGVFLYDDLKADAQAFLDRVTDFLDLAPAQAHTQSEPVNASRRPRLGMLDKLVADMGDWMLRNDLYRVKSLIGKTGIVDAVKRWNSQKGNEIDVTISRETLRGIGESLLGEVEKVEELTGRDLSRWKDGMR